MVDTIQIIATEKDSNLWIGKVVEKYGCDSASAKGLLEITLDIVDTWMAELEAKKVGCTSLIFLQLESS
jgi:hypothetical protein